jgi:type IV pilus assembly protein PilO
MKKISISAQSIEPVFERLEKLTKLQRILIFIFSLLILVGCFVYFSYMPNYKKITELENEYDKLENDLRIATIKARKLNSLRKQLAAAEAELRDVGKALPEKEEIPSLLAGISGSGQDSGLEFHLFQPRPEVKQDFYAELPISVTVQGTYHNVGAFFDKVSELPRIVNIRNVKIKPVSRDDSQDLTTSCTAVTYKFLDEASAPKKGK